MAKKPVPSIHVPIQTENGSMELAWYLYLKSIGEGGGSSTTVDWGDITNKPEFATVATSGSYNDLSNKPTIPIVNNSTITIKQHGVTKGSFTLNQSTGDTINLDAATWGGISGNIGDQTDLISLLSTKQDLLVAGENIVMTSLPLGYKRLNYIESSGTQSINTNVAVNIGNSFELDCAFLSGNVSDKHMISQGNNSLRVGAASMTWFSQTVHFVAGFTVGQNLKIECGLNYLTVDGTSITGTTDSDTVGGTYAYLFGKNDGSAYCLARLKSAKIYNSSNVLVFDGVPALRESDSAVGLYDNVSGTFFGSTTANNFIAGDIVGNVVISAVAPDELPDQTGNSGKFLTTNGTAPSWATVDALPSQAGNSGKYLTTDGTSASWGTFPVINYSINGGNYTAGTGSYAITRFSLMLQKADGTWEKPTDTSVTYSQATNKTVNTNGFLLNQILYYNNTTGISGGQLTGLNKVYSKHATVPMSYSTNCGTTPGWALGTWIYLVGTLGADGLFYLDTTQWWSDALPNSADGKLYIRLGPASSSTGDTVALLEDRPIFYHDGNGVKEYYPGGNGGGLGARQSIDAKIVGTLTINNSVVSGFSDSNYLELPGVFDLGRNNITSFEICGSFTTPADLSSWTNFLTSLSPDSSPLAVGLGLGVANTQYNNTLLVVVRGNTVQTFYGTTSLVANTEYFIKLQYDGTDYKLLLSGDGVNYNLDTTVTATSVPTPAIFCLGKDPLTAQSINMANWSIKINNVVIWQGIDCPGLHQRAPIGHEVIAFQAPTAGNNYTWYRKYADGWVEQGGFVSNVSGEQTVNFPITMADTNYTMFKTMAASTSNNVQYSNVSFYTRTTASAKTTTAGADFSWEVKGMYA